MASEELPQSMAFISYQDTPFSTAGTGSCSKFDHSSAKYLKEYPAKRVRASLGESSYQAIQAPERVGRFKRAHGRSDKLSTLSLDFLSETFSYLHPSDLVSLSRVNKYFRSMLLSRGSSALWNTCFKLCNAPASPADVSPQAWAHLLFGRAYCYSCGANPEDKILFSLRRRACKSCMAAHFLCLSNVPQRFRDMIRFELGNAGSMVYQQMPCCTRHWWDEDVAAFRAELNVFIYPVQPVGASDGGTADVQADVRAFLTRKEEEVKAIIEHALICAEWDKGRIASHCPKSFDVRVRHLEDIHSPFLQLGCSENDVDQLRRHREVRVGMSMPNRMWRVGPLLRSGVNEIRGGRASLDEEHGYCPDGSLVHDPSQVVVQENSYRQDCVALDTSTRSNCQPPTGGSRHEDFTLRGDGRLVHDHFKSVVQANSRNQSPQLDAPSYHPTCGRALQGNGDLDYDHSRVFMQANSQDHVPHLNASSYQSPISSAPEASASQYSTLTNALSFSVTPTQSQDSDGQVDAQPDPATASALRARRCPICQRTFRRVQERNRHVESYLPHSIYCPFQGCMWTGRRQWDFKEHWNENHPNSGQAPKRTNGIYDPKKFVKSIVDGTPLVEVVESACLVVTERLAGLGKVGEGVNVWGRKRKLNPELDTGNCY